jgi:protein ImuB
MMFACLYAPEHPAAVVKCAQAFSPLVEENAPGAIVLEASGLERLFGDPRRIAAAMAARAAEAGCKPHIALAANPDAALCAARGFPGISIVPQGDEAKFLGSLPLALLDPAPEIAETLARWGIRRFHDLAALPPCGLVERLGPEGLRLHALARGMVHRPLVALEEAPTFVEELELDYPVDDLEPLSFILSRLLNGLLVRLATRGLAAGALHLDLHLENRAAHRRPLTLPVPMLDGKALLKLLQLDLAARPPSAAIEKVRLELIPAEPRATQHGLFIPLAPEPEKLEVTLARLTSLAGENNVGTPALLDTHRPDEFEMRRFGGGSGGSAAAGDRGRGTGHGAVSLRRFRPPISARIELAAGAPAFLYAQSIRGNIVSAAGPWRTSGDWWTHTPWDRDEWDIAFAGGALYRLSCDRPTGRWFIDGTYD